MYNRIRITVDSNSNPAIVEMFSNWIEANKRCPYPVIDKS